MKTVERVLTESMLVRVDVKGSSGARGVGIGIASPGYSLEPEFVL